MRISAWFRKWHGRWPFIWPFIVLGVVCIFYVDGNVIPSLIRRHLILWGIFDFADLSWGIPELSILAIYLVAETISLLEMSYSYWFIGWFGRLSVKLAKQFAEREGIVQEAIEQGRRIESRLSREGFIQRMQIELNLWYEKITDQNSKFWKWLKRWGILAFVLIAVSPEPLARTVALIACRSMGRKKYLVLLIICDAVKTAYMVLGWHVVIHKLSWQTTIVIAAVILLWSLYNKYIKKENRA